jgi:hypothetical protein
MCLGSGDDIAGDGFIVILAVRESFQPELVSQPPWIVERHPKRQPQLFHMAGLRPMDFQAVWGLPAIRVWQGRSRRRELRISGLK